MEAKHQVDKFLEAIKVKDLDRYEVLNALRNIVLEIFPKVIESYKYGGIMFSLNDYFGGLFVSKNHVSFEFTFGFKLRSKLKLEGSGTYRRHLKVKVMSDYLEENLKELLVEIEAIDNNAKNSA